MGANKPVIRLPVSMCLSVVLLGFVVCSGCQSMRYWWQNDLKVGPNFSEPAASVAATYTDTDSPRIDSANISDSQWWHVFNDPQLDVLIEELYHQNLSLKTAACRIAEARAQRNVASANLFPQSQQAFAQYAHTQNSLQSAAFVPGFSQVSVDDWSTGFDASWEVDLWGRIRRNVTSADARLCATIKDYDFALVTLIGDVASLYVQIRSFDERLELAGKNVELQEGSLDIAQKRFKEGRTSKLDVVQAESSLAATRGLIPQLELARRKAGNALAVLLGMPPGEISFLTDSTGVIPEIPEQVIVGIPADLIRRRPDIRAAERLMAAQFEQIGIAHADLYPTFGLSGTLGWQAAQFSDLFSAGSLSGTVAPGFRWNILNYGRLKNNIVAQEAVHNQIRYDFQNTVLRAQREVEDGIIEFIKLKEQYVFDKQNEKANREAEKLATALFREGKENFGRVFVVQSTLVQAQDKLVATKADIALALIATYKSLGGGWEVRRDGFATAVSYESEAAFNEIDSAPPPAQAPPADSSPLPPVDDVDGDLKESIDEIDLSTSMQIRPGR